VAVLDPGDYKAGLKRRLDALLDREGSALGAADVGYYMEVQEAELKRLTAGTGVSVRRRGKTLQIGPWNRAFASGSVQPAAATRKMLAAIVPMLKEYNRTLITVHCYTDSRGAAAFNRTLSRRRALAVAHRLIEAGVAAGRIVVVGHGESDPVASNATARGRARNRRIALELQPLAH